MQNILDAAVGSMVWYVLGYGFAYGVSDHRANAFIGNHDFALTQVGGFGGGPGLCCCAADRNHAPPFA